MAPSRSRLRDLLTSRRPSAISRRKKARGERQRTTEALEERTLLSATLGERRLHEYQSFPEAHRLSAGENYLTEPQSGEAFQLGMDFLRSNASDLGVSVAEINSARVSRLYNDEASGVTHIYLHQQVNGLDVTNATINVNVSADGAVMSVGSTFVPNVNAPNTTPDIEVLPTLLSLATEFEWELINSDIVSQSNNLSRTTKLSDSGISKKEIPAELKYVSTSDGLDLAWQFEIQTLDGNSYYQATVSATDGSIDHLGDAVAQATYEVFAHPIEDPDTGMRTQEVDPHDLTASPFGWHDTNGAAGAEFTDTRGNNVDAFEDRNDDNAPGNRADGGAELLFVFDPNATAPQPFKWDPALPAEDPEQEEATITNLFYWNNIAHDIFYHYGFDEAAGNFQTNNYGRGGDGNDAVLAQALDSADLDPTPFNRNNANFLTLPDGQPGFMQMYVFTSTDPTRTSDFDNGIVVHEFGHGVSNRLTGGAADTFALQTGQARAMGEGWSDFLSIMTTQTSADTANGSRAIGAYALGGTAGFRDYPYSFNMQINPKTYGFYDVNARGPHPNGEIMAAAMWDLNWLLIDGDNGVPVGQGYDPDLYNGTGGNNIALRLALDAMKLQPTNPTFLEFRDSVLLADVNLTGGGNRVAIWKAFARRGMGFSAFDGGGNDRRIREAFDLPPDLLFKLEVQDTALPENGGSTTGRLFRGSTFDVASPVLVTLTNSDPTELVAPATVTIPAGSRFVDFSILAVDDTELDGTQTVSLTASANGEADSTVAIDVLDAEGLSLTIAEAEVREDAGANAATVTITRTNTDTNPSNVFVSLGNELLEFDRAGVLISSLPIEAGVEPRGAGEFARDLIVTPNDQVAFYNGTETAFLSLLDQNSNTWLHETTPDLSTDTNVSTGGIGALRQYVFMTDMNTIAGPQRGLVRYNRFTGRFDRFGTTIPGDRLFATSTGSSGTGNDLIEINPVTGDVINRLPIPPGASQGTRDGLAFDGRNLWFIGSDIDDKADDLYRLNPDTGAVLQQFDLGINSGIDGIAALNGFIYLMDNDQNNDIIEFDPIAGQTSRIIDIDAVNPGLAIGGGLAAGRDPDVLYVSDAFSGDIYEINPVDGEVIRPRSIVKVGEADLGLAVVGGELYVGIDGTSEITIVDRSTFAVDRTLDVTGADGGYQSLGGDDILGNVLSPYEFTDLAVGLDELVYALDEDGDIVSVYDPDTLDVDRFFQLDTIVSAIAVDSFGDIFGVTPTGDIHRFDSLGVTQATLATGFAGLMDIDLAISGDILIGSTVGDVIQTDVALTDFTRFSAGVGAAFVSYAAAPGTLSGDLTVTIQNSDTSEISVPGPIVIPAGSQSVTFPIDAVDDRLFDGTQTVTLTPFAAGYAEISGDSIDVTDVENIEIVIDKDFILETDGPEAATLTLTRSNIDGPFDAQSVRIAANSDDTPILDADTIISRVNIAEQIAFVDDVDVTINLEHGHLGDLDVFLVSPSGTRVELFTDVGGIGEVMSELVLDDEASSPVTSGSAPFSARYMPEESLGKFNGEPISGTWTLEVTDDTNLSSGTLLDWELKLGALGFAEATIDVLSQDSSEAIPSIQTIVIPQNQLSITVPIDAIDDNLLDGIQNVIFTASGSGYFPGDDDINVNDAETIQLTIDREEISEDAGANAAIGTVTRTDDGDLSNPVVVNLESRDRSELTVPATVTIPAGQMSATFDIDAVDDFKLDGTIRVRINASSTGYDFTKDSKAFVFVTDAEEVLEVELDVDEAFENDRFVTGVLRRTNYSSLDDSLAVSLTSSLPAEVTVPPSVTIPAGQESVVFTITLTDNDVLNGQRDVTISAEAAGTFGGSDVLVLKDFETLSLEFSPDEFHEARRSQASTGTVTRNNSDIDSALEVRLAGDDATELGVPETVVIPAGQASVEFPITAVNDDIFDGAQVVGITAEADGYISATGDVTVLDHEPTIITGPDRVVNTARPTITWEAVEGATRYHIRINNVSTGENRVVNIDDLASDVTSFTPTQQLEIGRHRVFVRYQNEFEQWQPFTPGYLIEVLPAPTFTSPISLPKEDVPNFAWTDIIGAESFQLQVHDLTRDIRRVINERDLVNTSFQPETLRAGLYEAEVRAVGPNGIKGPWVQTEFTVLPRPVILTPSGGPSFDQTPTITFEGSVEADHYDVRIHDLTIGLNDGGRNIVRDRFVTDTTFTPEFEFELGHKYQISVAAVTASGERSAFSKRVVHKVGARPVILSPADGGETGVIPVIRFEGVEDAKKHQVRIRVDGGKGNIVYDRSVQGNAFSPRNPLVEGQTYRVWVRAVSILGQKTPWASVRFTVTADTLSQEYQLDQSDSGDAATPSDVTVERETAHRSQLIVVNSYVDELEQTTTPHRPQSVPTVEVTPLENAVPLHDADVIDSVMESLSGVDADWWAVGGETASQDDGTSGESELSPALAGGAVLLGAALATTKRNRRDED